MIRLIGVVLLLAVASCAAPQATALRGGSPMIDEPVAPFPYNSKFCT